MGFFPLQQLWPGVFNGKKKHVIITALDEIAQHLCPLPAGLRKLTEEHVFLIWFVGLGDEVNNFVPNRSYSKVFSLFHWAASSRLWFFSCALSLQNYFMRSFPLIALQFELPFFWMVSSLNGFVSASWAELSFLRKQNMFIWSLLPSQTWQSKYKSSFCKELTWMNIHGMGPRENSEQSQSRCVLAVPNKSVDTVLQYVHHCL